MRIAISPREFRRNFVPSRAIILGPSCGWYIFHSFPSMKSVAFAKGVLERIDMSGSRRDFLARRGFLVQGTLGLLSAAVAGHAQTPQTQQPTPGAPPAFGTAPPVGPEVSAATFADAERLVQVKMSAPNRAEAAENWRMAMAPLYERRTGPRKLAIEESVAPATQWNPMLPGLTHYPAAGLFVRSAASGAALPANDEDIAFATVTQLSRWIESRQITSERLTQIYLDRIA